MVGQSGFSGSTLTVSPRNHISFLLSSPEDMFINFRERGRDGGEVRERNNNWLLLVCTPTGDCTHNLGMFSDWGLNLQPLVYKTML